jgi:hypothetical protein
LEGFPFRLTAIEFRLQLVGPAAILLRMRLSDGEIGLQSGCGDGALTVGASFQDHSRRDGRDEHEQDEKDGLQQHEV